VEELETHHRFLLGKVQEEEGVMEEQAEQIQRLEVMVNQVV